MLYIVLDTNIMFENSFNDFSTFMVSGKFKKIYELINKDIGMYRDKIKILIPAIVIEELLQKRKEEFNDAKKIFSDYAGKMGNLVKVGYSEDVFEYSTYLKKQIDICISSYENLEIIPLCCKENFTEIIERAISKLPPFEGKDKNSDKGFKDTVILYSVIDYAKQHPGDYVFYSQDKRFLGNDGEQLARLFRKHTHCEMYSYNEINQIKEELIYSTSDEGIENVTITTTLDEKVRGGISGQIKISEKMEMPYILANKKPALNRINNDIESYYSGVKQKWSEIDLNIEYPSYPEMEYNTSLTYSVSFNKRGFLSILFKEYAYVGGVHGGCTQNSRVYNLNYGRMVLLSEMIGITGNELIKKVCNVILTDKAINPNKYYDFFIPHFNSEEEINWYLSDDGIHVFFNEYIANCYAAGIIDTLIIPTSEIIF